MARSHLLLRCCRRGDAAHSHRASSQKKTTVKADLEFREDLSESRIIVDAYPAKLLAVNEAVDLLEAEDQVAAELVKLRYFVAMSMQQAADSMNPSLRSAEPLWTFAKAFLKNRMKTE